MPDVEQLSLACVQAFTPRVCQGSLCTQSLRYWNKSGYCQRCWNSSHFHRKSQMKWRANNKERHRTAQKRRQLRRMERIKADPQKVTHELILHAARRATRRGLRCSMVLADLMPLSEYCPVLPWIRLDYGNNHGDRNMWASIDRIDPRIGYVA